MVGPQWGEFPVSLGELGLWKIENGRLLLTGHPPPFLGRHQQVGFAMLEGWGSEAWLLVCCC